MIEHAFDQAMALVPSATEPGRFSGHTSADYWNMVGPFGGTTAAVLLQAVLRHPDLLGVPVALTVNYAAALNEGAFEILVLAARTNRSTQHWTMQLLQGGELCATATAFTALRRPSWNACDLNMPAVPRPQDVERLSIGPRGVAWIRQYEMRPITGSIPTVWDGGGTHSETVMWLRDAQPRGLDFAALAAFTDTFYPRVWLRRATPVPIGTVSLSTYFHADAALLAEASDGYLLARAVGQRFYEGYFDQAAQLWSEEGTLLATSSQVVYYKE